MVRIEPDIIKVIYDGGEMILDENDIKKALLLIGSKEIERIKNNIYEDRNIFSTKYQVESLGEINKLTTIASIIEDDILNAE